MSLVAALTTVGALPAHAAHLEPGVTIPVVADRVAETAAARAAAGPVQSVTVTAQAPVTVQVDTFTAKEIPPPPPPVAAPAAVAAVAAGVEAPAAAAAGAAVRWPFVGPTRMSDGFGPRNAPCSGCSSFHDGLDLNPGVGAPIGAIADGIVSSVTAYDNGGLGVHVMIDHVVDGQRVTSTYGHMLSGSAAVSEGQSVTAGQLVGNVGSTGQSTGPHLHLEIYSGSTALDPYAWLTQHAGPM
jgi:murein DD-endopeptidase MepM/ murein hydrolase activator NlpD